MAQFLVGLLVYLFPKEVVAKMLVILLVKIATLTPTQVDDALVASIAKALEAKDERVV